MGNGITEGETSDRKGGTGSLENLLGEQKTSWFDWNKGHVRGTVEMRLERQSGQVTEDSSVTHWQGAKDITDQQMTGSGPGQSSPGQQCGGQPERGGG